jgi:hypothetical protein
VLVPIRANPGRPFGRGPAVTPHCSLSTKQETGPKARPRSSFRRSQAGRSLSLCSRLARRHRFGDQGIATVSARRTIGFVQERSPTNLGMAPPTLPQPRSTSTARGVHCTVVRFSFGFAEFESSSPDLVAAAAMNQQSRSAPRPAAWGRTERSAGPERCRTNQTTLSPKRRYRNLLTFPWVVSPR